MLLFGGLGMIATAPIFNALSGTNLPFTAFLLIAGALAIVSYTSVGGIVKAELFPPHVRALSVGLACALANACSAARPNTSPSTSSQPGTSRRSTDA